MDYFWLARSSFKAIHGGSAARITARRREDPFDATRPRNLRPQQVVAPGGASKHHMATPAARRRRVLPLQATPAAEVPGIAVGQRLWGARHR